MNRTAFSLPEHSEYRTRGGLEVSRTVERFAGGSKLDELIELIDRRRGVVLSSGTTVPGRYESFDLGFADPPLRLESTGFKFFIEAWTARARFVLVFLGKAISDSCAATTERSAARLTGHIIRGDAPLLEEERTR